jgi:hypothetical protein
MIWFITARGVGYVTAAVQPFHSFFSTLRVLCGAVAVPSFSMSDGIPASFVVVAPDGSLVNVLLILLQSFY